MHPNPAFRPALPGDARGFYADFIAEVGMGMVFAPTPDGPRVAHVPLIARDEGRVAFHLARGNALTRHLDGATALVVINGPDGYVSPRWYGDSGQVPTWNYLALEGEGVAHRIDRAALLAQLTDISALNEARLGGEAWTMDKVQAATLSRLLDGIVGFELAVTAWRPTFKLSQNKSAHDRAAVADGLEAAGAGAIATLMRAFGPADQR